ncbi:MAG TPA: translation factor GTPase family protein [Caulobacteraceae bacterium]|nr:translation factor GTPase family protein [Caulobacteraceae bacterium]
MRCLNLGILAHVDAGKTSLTERLLFEAGVIDAVGSVDAGDTQTDTLALERARGITIRAAVVSFAIGGTTINLIDTPGHPDFIAEVERVLALLDGAVLVISAVEGVQAQTRVLFAALQRLGVPTLIFVNKIDRAGAQEAALLDQIAERLSPHIVVMGEVSDLGRRNAAFQPFGAEDPAFAAGLAERLADQDDRLLAAFVADRPPPYAELRAALAIQTQACRMHPVFFGSAITGAGVEALQAGIAELLPSPEPDARAPLSGAVFKVERGSAGERIAYARLWSGRADVRERLTVHGQERRITRIEVFDNGAAKPSERLQAGRIGKLWGLGDIRIGDPLGEPRGGPTRHFASPTLETVVRPVHPADKGRLFAALAQMAEQDPLIALRQDDRRGEIAVSLYGEVQKEVIRDTLAADFRVEAAFDETTPICIERLVGEGASLWEPPYPFMARVGLRVAPRPPGAGVEFRLEVEAGSLPAAFFKAVEDGVRETLNQGLSGWAIPDVLVAMTHVIRYRHFATSTAADHRHLAPLALMQAVKRAGTVVCEPIDRFTLTAPERALSLLLPELAKLEAEMQGQASDGRTAVIEGEIPVRRVHALQQRLPVLTQGEGVLESAFDHHRPVKGEAPVRARTDANPLNRKEYLQNLARRL